MTLHAEQISALLERLETTADVNTRLEEVIRPLLQLLEEITGLPSTYFTVIDVVGQVQTVVYARNTGRLTIPEGLSAPWQDTLCRRAILEGRHYTQHVAGCWGDSAAARELGLETYLSEPIRLIDDGLYGTLCAASDESVEVSDQAQAYMVLFAQLIARYIESERLLHLLASENRILVHHANTDPLTGIANRRALLHELKVRLGKAAALGRRLYVAFIDLDGFKAINDRFGHDAGDRFLIEMAHRLVAGCRPEDLVARFGGDEFVVVHLADEATEAALDAFKQALERLTVGEFRACDDVIDYPGASVGVVAASPDEHDTETILQLCDAAMYERKQARRRGSG